MSYGPRFGTTAHLHDPLTSFRTPRYRHRYNNPYEHKYFNSKPAPHPQNPDPTYLRHENIAAMLEGSLSNQPPPGQIPPIRPQSGFMRAIILARFMRPTKILVAMCLYCGIGGTFLAGMLSSIFSSVTFDLYTLFFSMLYVWVLWVSYHVAYTDCQAFAVDQGVYVPLPPPLSPRVVNLCDICGVPHEGLLCPPRGVHL